MSHRWSMSKAHAECLYPYRLDVAVRSRPAGKEARIGSLTHQMTDARIKGVEQSYADADPTELATAMAYFNGPYRGWLDSRKWEACELGLRYDTETDATVLGPRRGEPDYDDHGPMVLKGTLDLVRIADGALWVADLKTGKRDGAHVEQLYAQAVAASRLYGIAQAYVGFVFARKTKCDEPSWEHLDADRLDAEAGKIRRKLRMLPTAEPVPGKYCAYCDAWSDCPKGQRNREYVPAEPPAEDVWAF